MALGDTFSINESIRGAALAARSKRKTDEYVSGKQRQQTLDDLSGRAAAGEDVAAKTLIGMDPERAVNVITAVNGADKLQRDKMKASNNEFAKAITWSMQAGTEEERAQRWDQSIDHLVNNMGLKDLEKHRGTYSQDNAQMLLTGAMSFDQLMEDAEFGDLEVGIKDGKPVYFMTSKRGEAKVVKGITPPADKMGGKDSRTALQKNVPFVSKKMKISEEDATKLLTASKAKSPQQVYTDMYGRALSATFGDKEEANTIAGEVMALLYGDDWQSQLPQGKGTEQEKTDPNDPNSIRSYLNK